MADLALNAGMPIAPNLPESNCSYLAAILSINDLQGWTCYNNNLNVICNVRGVGRSSNTRNAKTYLYSMKLKSQLTEKLEKKPSKGLIELSRT